jgi:hypothetical protein
MDPTSDSKSESIPVIARTNQELTPACARDLIQSKENATTLPPINPVGGTVFLYYNSGKEGDWKADGYRWYQNGRKNLPTSGPIVVKTYYVLLVEGTSGPVKDKDFRRVAYHLVDDIKGTQGTLIQYLGTVPENGHGNASKIKKNHNDTIEEEC